MQTRQRCQVFFRCQLIFQRRRVTDEQYIGTHQRSKRPHRLAAPADVARYGLSCAGENAQERCLAATVWATDEEHLTGLEREVEFGEQLCVTAPRGQTLHVEHSDPFRGDEMTARIIAERSGRAPAGVRG